jgi:DNA-binding response OmpR family regulator
MTIYQPMDNYQTRVSHDAGHGAMIVDPSVSGHLLLISPDGTARGKLEEQLRRLGFTVTLLQQAPETLALVQTAAHACDAIVLDWRSGCDKDRSFAEALAKTAANAQIPVLTLAADCRADDVRLAAEAGLPQHLSMPCQLSKLKAVLMTMLARPHAAAGHASAPINLEDAVSLLEHCKFRFRTPEDVEKLVPLLARLFPHPDRTATGIAELMLNAIEHGNLEIGHERKADWVAQGIYQGELAKRLATPPFSERWAEVIITKRDDGVMIVILDQGCGFCWQNFVANEPAPTGAIAEPNGHGIAMAKDVSFDQLRFNHQGNQVTAFVSNESLAW